MLQHAFARARDGGSRDARRRRLPLMPLPRALALRQRHDARQRHNASAGRSPASGMTTTPPRHFLSFCAGRWVIDDATQLISNAGGMAALTAACSLAISGRCIFKRVERRFTPVGAEGAYFGPRYSFLSRLARSYDTGRHIYDGATHLGMMMPRAFTAFRPHSCRLRHCR